MKKRDLKAKQKKQHQSPDSWKEASPKAETKTEADEFQEDFLSFTQVKDFSINKANDLSEEQIFNKAKQYPWLSKQTLRIKDIFLFMHSEILDFVQYISPTEADKQLRQSVVDRISKVINGAYPGAKVCVFGSCATGLNLPKSDIDLLCYLPSVKELTLIGKLTSELLRSGICSSIEPIKSAKCPIIKLTDKQTGINVDISFNRENGIHCVHLVRQLMRKYPELRPMLLILKCFLKSRQLNETYHGGVSSFLLTMLVVSHLQRQYKRFGKHTDVDLGKHLIDFFELYGTLFNYEDVGISIRSGYFTKESRGWEGWDDRSRFRLCVENPQDQSVDIGKASYNIKRVQRAFQHAYDTLIFNNSSSISLLKLIITCDASELRPETKP